MPTRVRVDCSAASYLPVCEQCAWRALPRPTKRLAVALADQHALAVHGDPRARKAIEARRRRVAA